MQLYPKPRKKSVMPTDYKTKILVAAIKVFAQKGYVNTTMSDIAIHAKVGIGTLYNYFKNKDDLLLQCMKKVVDDVISIIQAEAEPIKDPIERLYDFFVRHAELVVAKPYIAKFLVVELRQSESFYKRNPSFNPMQYYLDYIAKLLQKAMDKGRIRTFDVTALSYIIFGAMDMLLTQWFISGKTLELKPLIQNIRTILGMGLLEDKKR